MSGGVLNVTIASEADSSLYPPQEPLVQIEMMGPDAVAITIGTYVDKTGGLDDDKRTAIIRTADLHAALGFARQRRYGR